LAEGNKPQAEDGAAGAAPRPADAVFISYASQDAAAAQRIAEALRAAGIDVWFDQSELRGGDAWDASIRRQIKNCALFIPLISKNTHTRGEGYFRLEWKLAVDRSHLMASDLPFLLPVVIDDTPDQEERVPDRFLEVQWTRLLHGASTNAFVDHVRRLLAPEATTPTATIVRFTAPPNLSTVVASARIALTAIVLSVGVGIAVMLHAAITSRSVVVESFDVPPTLSERGESGTVVASGVLDELIKLQNATRISAALAASAGIDSSKRTLSKAWSNEIKLATPQTGISFGEMYQLLKNRFGNDIHISGSLIETETGGLMLTVRGDGVPPMSIKGSAGELMTMSVAAAEYVYAESQPALWVKYLITRQRYAEVINFAKDAVVNGEPSNRPYFFTFWASALARSGGSKTDAVRLLRQALSLKPDYWTPYEEISELATAEGNEEGAWRVGQQLRNVAGGRPGRAPGAAFSQWDFLTWNLSERLQAMQTEADFFGGRSAIQSDIAAIEALRHDPDAAELALNAINSNDADSYVVAGTHWVRGVLGLDAGDGATGSMEMEAFSAALMDPAIADDYAVERCWIAPAEQAAGHPEKADTVLNEGRTFIDCYRFHGDILESRGDWQGAQAWYANAVTLAPDLPAGYYSWGVALAKRGDLGASEVRLKEANQRGPHWADPLKEWGDVLMREGKIKEALTKYDEALRYAPNWKQLKDAREVAAKN
jgi:hypothetical protein